MTASGPRVFLVDDDASVRKGMARLLASEGFEVGVFDSAATFLEQCDLGAPGCVLLDLAMPGIDGMDVQDTLARRGSLLSVVFLTGHGSIHASVRAMKSGAVDFLTKPPEKAELLTALTQALDRNAAARKQRDERAVVERLLELLTPREREVLACLTTGRRNKQIASDLGTVEKTIKVHRARVLQKMEVATLAELIQRLAHAGIEVSWHSSIPMLDQRTSERAVRNRPS